jgi:hypothetical protein
LRTSKQTCPFPPKSDGAEVKIFDRFPWLRPINGLSIAKDMTETPPAIQRTIAGNLLSTAPVHFGAVIPEIDIWRAAQLMLKRYGERTLEESAARADELALAGDDAGAVTWRRIMAAVIQLANKTPSGPVR